MHNNKLSTTAALVAALVFPGVAVAATDDMGMQYTSASEGLTGSFRVNLYHSEDDGMPTGDKTNGAGLDSLRLTFAGSADLGNGLSSTYALELRSSPQGTGMPEPTDATKTNLGGSYAHSYHIGMDGVFGSLQFGRIAGAGYMVPGGSLDSIKGNSRKAPTEDPGDNTFKFTSPSINGLQFGFSAVMNDSGAATDDLLDEVAFAGIYDTPLGLKLGAAYEKEAQSTGSTAAKMRQDDVTGYRFGAHYGQDNWTVAYEFRSYDNFDGEIVKANDATTMSLSDGTNSTSNFGSGMTVNDYAVHGFGVRFNLDKITASANYSTEEVSFGAVQSPNQTASTPVDLGRTALGVDVKYELGSKSSILLGFSSTETDQHAENDYSTLGTSADKDETTLRYQVDF
jgi:predicted porin